MESLIEITIPAGEGAPATPAVALLPQGAKRGVVVIHEIFGRQPEIDRAVERIAAAGYAVVAPDLFAARGKVACLMDVFKAMRTGDGPAVQQGRNARAWLCEKTAIEPRRVGLIGFCFGGGYALSAGAGWGAISANYGQVPRTDAMRGIGPVIACYGGRDKTMAKEPAKLRERLGEVGQDDFEVHVLDAGHSFLTDGKPHLIQKIAPMGFGEYPQARAEAWERILGFFEKHLA
jgi:carboxymethylenebutenolidase